MITLSKRSLGTQYIKLRPEAQLLLYLSRKTVNFDTVEHTKTLLQTNTIDWVYLLQLAEQHGVMPLLSGNLQTLGVDTIGQSAIPQFVFDRLQLVGQLNTLRNLFLVGELVKLLDLLKQQGVPAIPFKGPTLAALAYGNISLRKAGDLDILVHEQDFRKARDILLAQGYQPVVQPWFLDEAQETAYLESRNEYTLIHPETQVCIDLHRRLAAGDFFLMPIDFEQLWNFTILHQRLNPIAVAGRTLPALQAEDLLLYLCVHGSKHLWTRLAWICDVAELVRSHPQLNWDLVFQKAQTLGCDRMLSVGLLLANDLLGATISENVRQRAKANPKHQRLATLVQTWLFRETGAPPKGFSVERVYFHLREIEALSGKMQYFYRSLGHYGLAPVRRAITPTIKDRLFVQLPLHLFPLYYLVRPVRLLRDIGLALWQRHATVQKNV
jgi:hypothetical protein